MIRAGDRLAQAKRDLSHAERSKTMGDHEWVCFAAQQASEKAVRALLNQLGLEIRGHSVLEPLEEASRHVEMPKELFECAKTLDKHYIPPRYPNAYASGAPFQYYSNRDSEGAIEAAWRIFRFAEPFVERKGV